MSRSVQKKIAGKKANKNASVNSRGSRGAPSFVTRGWPAGSVGVSPAAEDDNNNRDGASECWLAWFAATVGKPTAETPLEGLRVAVPSPPQRPASGQGAPLERPPGCSGRKRNMVCSPPPCGKCRITIGWASLRSFVQEMIAIAWHETPAVTAG